MYLWSVLTRINGKNKSNYPKIVYSFEFVACSSRFEEMSKSKAYVGLVNIENFDEILKVTV
jgi:hypothetical protein